MRKLTTLLIAIILFSSCASKKELLALQEEHNVTKAALVNAKASLQKCLIDQEKEDIKALSLAEQVKTLKADKKNALKQVEDLTVLTKSSSEGINNIIAQLSEKDKYINGIRSAMTQKDSLNLAIKYHLTKNLTDGIQDKDIEVNVEKTVVFISISDKLLFKTGSYNISARANEILGKVATVINGKPNFEAMVEGHTDNVPYNKGGVLVDNWDLSVKRSTAIVRALQDLGVDPKQLIAAGRGDHLPLVLNDSPTNRAINRRTKIYILPKIDQFYEMIETEMKNLSKE